MPIYDTDNGTPYEVGTIYDYTGIANEIGKVWDVDGGVAYLIHSADETIYPGYAAVTQKWGATSGAVGMQVYSYNGGDAAKAYIAFDATSWNKVTVAYSFQTATYSIGFLGLKSSLVEAVAYIPTANYSVGTIQYTNGTATATSGTVELDISAYSGIVYLVAHCYTGSANNYARIAVDSVVLS